MVPVGEGGDVGVGTFSDAPEEEFPWEELGLVKLGEIGGWRRGCCSAQATLIPAHPKQQQYTATAQRHLAHERQYQRRIDVMQTAPYGKPC